jgi:ribosomal protein L3-specific protein-(glutamine-N5) methyltransferase
VAKARSKLPPRELTTILDFIRYAATHFVEAKLGFGQGTDDPIEESIFLVAESLHLPVARIDSFLAARLTEPERKRVFALIDTRIRTRTPAAYLLNRAYLQGVPFYVDKRVIVPRSYIAELLYSEAFQGEQPLVDRGAAARVLDLCTGSGCVAVSLARERPTSRGIAADVSPDAIAVAAENALRLGAYNVGFVVSDVFAALQPGKGRFDVITANPPYIAQAEIPTLTVDIRGYEPALALDGGSDGLAVVERIVAGAARFLAPGGVLAVEIGSDQGPAVRALFATAGFSDVEVRRDYGGLDRVVSGTAR